jgi:hypothetical protein
MSELCVVHLVRYQNGVEPFKRFLTSYLENNAGSEHDLLIVYKGFRQNKDIAEYEKLLEDIPHNITFVSDSGFDITAYLKTVKRFNYKYYFFLNSFSVIKTNNWLANMYSHILNEEVGIVGATGSYESPYTHMLNVYDSCKRGYYVRERKVIIRSFVKLLQTIQIRFKLLQYKKYFYPAPNYHIRTNAFMISRKNISKIRYKSIRSKMDAHRFESGKDSLTRQISNMRLDVLVVGKNGRAYKKEEWCSSNTFRQGEQENLMIDDNQTINYMNCDSKEKSSLYHSTWRT